MAGMQGRATLGGLPMASSGNTFAGFYAAQKSSDMSASQPFEKTLKELRERSVGSRMSQTSAGRATADLAGADRIGLKTQIGMRESMLPGLNPRGANQRSATRFGNSDSIEHNQPFGLSASGQKLGRATGLGGLVSNQSLRKVGASPMQRRLRTPTRPAEELKIDTETERYLNQEEIGSW